MARVFADLSVAFKIRDYLIKIMQECIELEDYKIALEVWENIDRLMVAILKEGIDATASDVSRDERGSARTGSDCSEGSC